MKILITGGAGFVGANLAVYMRKRGHEVISMDNLVRRGSELNLPRLKAEGVQFVHGDVRNAEDFATLPKVDVILETSAQPSAIAGYANPIFDITNNTLGLVHVLEHARKTDAGVVFWSTNKVYSGDKINAIPIREGHTRWSWDLDAIRAKYGDRVPEGFDPRHGFSETFTVDGGQHSIYGLSKVMADIACQEYADAFGVRTVINRCSCLAGEGQFGKSEQGWVAWWAVAHEFGFPLTYYGWGGKQVRDVLFVEDLARLVELEIKNLDKVKGEVFSVGGGIDNTLSLQEATSMMTERYGRKVPTTIVPEARKADHCVYISDIRKAKQRLGWEPKLSVKEGYERIVQWVETNKDALRGLYA